MRSSALLLSVSLVSAVIILATAVPTLHERERSLVKRQDAPSCVNQSDCYSGQPPLALVQCLDNGLCSCQECFSLNTTINRCYEEYPTCYFYNSSTGQCQDERPSQAVAFYLSLCLSSVGAANFYIGRNDLGGIQIALFISLFAVLYCVCYAMCCMFCGIAGEEKGLILGTIAGIIVVVLVAVWIIAASLAMLAWWIADLVIFAENDRTAGNGCPLNPNL